MTINFPNLPCAINYRYQCPFCKNSMKVEPGCIEWEVKEHDSYYYIKGNDNYYADNSLSYRNYPKTLIKFGDYESSVSVDYETGEVVSVTRSMRDTYSHYNTYAGPSYGNYSYNGLSDYNMYPITMHCSTCKYYRYTIQVHISLIEKRVVNVCLNSESLYFKDKRGYYLIRNVYTTDKTEYHFNNFEDADTRPDSNPEIYFGYFDKTIELPLISLDMEEPTKTLERVKTLVLFS